VLGHQLLVVVVVVGQREPPHALAASHEDVDEVVDHQGDLDGVDRRQLDHASKPLTSSWQGRKHLPGQVAL
jgi:hypothetical protein